MNKYERFYIEIAGLCVEINARYPFAYSHCRDYLSDRTDADFSVSVTDAEIDAEMANYDEGTFGRDYCEDVCIYRAIAEKLPLYDRLVVHGAAVSINGRGVVFTAPSGTGKTTHIGLLMDNYPNDVSIINGDKPIIHVKADGVCVCSTPWAGKEDLNANVISPLGTICLVARAKENAISKIDPAQHFSFIMKQMYLPISGESRLLTLDLADKLAKSVDFYLLECNISSDAAKCSFEALGK